MTELEQYQPNPLEQINIAAYRAPSYEELSDEQKAQLDQTGVRWVEQQAITDTFETPLEFRYHSNNFLLHFGSGMLGPAYRGQAHYKRFEVVHPDISAYMQNMIGNKTMDKLDDSHLRNLMKAYEIIRNYLDVNDPYVKQNDKMDTYFLCR